MSSKEKKFKKRQGTSGISGHLYETKLISLVLFRLLHDDNIETFDLASNMDDIGAFDDLCLKLKVKGINKPLLIFIQAKHKDYNNTFLNYDLIKNFHVSLVKVKENFKAIDKKYDNVFFTDSFVDTDCLFIIYTNAKFLDDTNTGKSDQTAGTASISNQAKRQCQKDFNENLNNLICTNKDSEGFHLDFTSKNLEYVAKQILEEELRILAKHFTKFLTDKEKQSMNIMHDEYMMRYNVILRQINVVEVSEVQSQRQASEIEPDQPQPMKLATEDWRYLNFVPDFFETDNEILSIFRNKIFEILIKNRGNTKKDKKPENLPINDLSEMVIDQQISSFLAEPSAINLSYLIDKYIIFKNEKLEFLVDRPNSDQMTLEQINILPTTIYKAQELSVKYFLQRLKLKVPVTFGNLDMTLKGNKIKVDKSIKRLANFLSDLCKLFEYKEPHYIVTVGEDIKVEHLSQSGGIGGAVGNLFVYDKETNLMKFVEDDASLQKNARSIFDELVKNISNLHLYRFRVKAMNFPKLVFDCYLNEAKALLDNLLIFEKQSNQEGVEKILINEIKEHVKNDTSQTFSANLDALFVHYHHEIQLWWMSKIGKYLTKGKDLYQYAVNKIIAEPQMCALQYTFFSNIKHRIFTFHEKATDSFNSLETITNNIIVTNVGSLMVMKVIQYLRNMDKNKYMVLDLKYTLNLTVKDLRALNSELCDTEKIIIVICDSVESSALYHKRLLNISQAVEEKEIVVITTKEFNAFIDKDVLVEYFTQINNVNDDKVIHFSLNDLTPESRMDIIDNVKVIFQGAETSFKTFLDNASFDFIGGFVLNKIIGNENIIIGESLSNSKYEEIKHLYVSRRISRTKNVSIYVRTFFDIKQDCVLVTAEPGMGKSILLTHLSLRTKELVENTWILRVNLLDHSKEFHNWQKNKIKIDTLNVLKFLCQIQLKNKELSICLNEIDNKIFLGACTEDEATNFELNMFLYYYNNGRMVILFDGFDEICPHYKNTVLDLLNTVKKMPQKNKMWVTSRPYNEILPELETVLGKSYKIEYISDEEQEQYLYDIWASKLALDTLTDFQLCSLISFADYILDKILNKKFPDTMHFTFHRMYYFFYKFVQAQTNKDLTVSNDLINEMSEPSPSTSRQANTLVDKLVGTPLLLYLVADYFVNVVNNMEYVEWDLNINIIKIYESFIDTKIKTILFEDKNKMDIYMPDVKSRYEKDRVDCVAEHKKLGAYVILKNKIFYDDCPLEEFNDMQPFKDQGEYEAVVDVIKTGKEKTGLISHVSMDNIPVFIHRTFAEYFAIEFLCDIFESDIDFENKQLLFTAIYTYGTIDIRPWLHEKRAVDKYIDYVIESIINKKPVVMSWHRELFSRGDWGIDHLLRLLNSCPTDYEVDWCPKIKQDFVDILNDLDPEGRRKRIRHFQCYVISKMKPHLKQYFGSVILLRGCKQMINWMGGKITLP